MSLMLILEIRTLITAVALVFAVMILGDTRRIYRVPWAFFFLALRCTVSLGVRGSLLMGVTLDPHLQGLLMTFNEFLILLTLIAMWLGYGTVFNETPLRCFIRRYWPFK